MENFSSDLLFRKISIVYICIVDSPVHKPSRSFESRRKQATAIVMLAVIGAEFGHEVMPSRRGVDDGKPVKKGLEGFTSSNYSLARHTSTSLQKFNWY